MSVEFFVPGVPVPKGSKTAFVVGKRAVVADSNRAALKPWEATIAQAAHEMQVRFDEPVRVVAEFRFVRPKSVSERKRPWPSVKPDGDKTLRALLDGLVAGGLLRDDALVVDMTARKRYAPAPGVWVQIAPMDEEGM